MLCYSAPAAGATVPGIDSLTKRRDDSVRRRQGAVINPREPKGGQETKREEESIPFVRARAEGLQARLSCRTDVSMAGGGGPAISEISIRSPGSRAGKGWLTGRPGG